MKENKQSILRGILSLDAEQNDEPDFVPGPTLNERVMAELKKAHGPGVSYSREQRVEARAKAIDEMAKELADSGNRRMATATTRPKSASAVERTDAAGPSIAGLFELLGRSLMPATRWGAAAATLFSCILVASLAYLSWKPSSESLTSLLGSPRSSVGPRSAQPVIASIPLLLPDDAETIEFVGYWGDYVKTAKNNTEVGSERISLTVSPKSNFVSGHVVQKDDKGEHRFSVLGVRAQSPDKRRDEFSLSFIGEPKDDDTRPEAEKNASALTTGTYVLRKFDDKSYTGVAVYWDKCNQVWVQCPYALERGTKADGNPGSYTKGRWPTRFDLGQLENQCHEVIQKLVDPTVADRGSPPEDPSKCS
ncbi:hypothetical protein ACQR1W_12620 [Bradyrhizobium sp. HKCCYLS1011]|uniref:hypothetical protein n=1 Tax=Bradyrhizobium sp. HKCCYLS1011 TaxID=3420733 RepID=UPI003EBE81C5